MRPATQEETALSDSPRRIMPLGDSITWGFEGVSGAVQNSGGYRGILWNGLLWNGWSPGSFGFVGSAWNGSPPGDPSGVDNGQEGHPGWTSRDLADNIEWILDSGRPELVLLTIGTNDLFQGFSTDDSVAAMSASYDAMLRRDFVRHLYVASIPACLTAGIGKLHNSSIAALNETIRDLVTSRNDDRITFVDMNRWSGIGDGDLSDGVHPNDAGYAKMGLVWTIAIRNAR